MLPPFIIEQIRRREEQERVRDDQPRLELPLHPPASRRKPPASEDAERGVVVIELL